MRWFSVVYKNLVLCCDILYLFQHILYVCVPHVTAVQIFEKKFFFFCLIFLHRICTYMFRNLWKKNIRTNIIYINEMKIEFNLMVVCYFSIIFFYIYKTQHTRLNRK